MRRVKLPLGVLVLVAAVLGQSPQPGVPTEAGMYLATANSNIKILGQIVTFTRSGSLAVSALTAGIKTAKANVQLLGPHAQTATDEKPLFYFIPAKQEAEAGVNAGDVVLIRLEKKAKRRQFEVAASGLWRGSSGISITHQVQLFRSEEKAGVFKLTPASPLSKGEYALYLTRGEGLSAYVYDFSVDRENGTKSTGHTENTPSVESPTNSAGNPSLTAAGPTGPSQQLASTPAGPLPQLKARPATASTTASSVQPGPDTSVAPSYSEGDVFEEASIGASFHGKPTIRHDGVEVYDVQQGGVAEDIGIKAGDFILALDDHYIFTIQELDTELRSHPSGSRVDIRYRRNALIYDNLITLGPRHP
jgi:hypothetical protein